MVRENEVKKHSKGMCGRRIEAMGKNRQNYTCRGQSRWCCAIHWFPISKKVSQSSSDLIMSEDLYYAEELKILSLFSLSRCPVHIYPEDPISSIAFVTGCYTYRTATETKDLNKDLLLLWSRSRSSTHELSSMSYS